MRPSTIIQNQSLPPLCSIWPAADQLWGPRARHELHHCTKNKQMNGSEMKPVLLLVLWLPLHCWPKCFLLGCSRVLGLGFRDACRLLRFGLQGIEAKDLTVLVALVQRFELVNERGSTVSLEAFVPATDRGVVSHPACGHMQLLLVCLLTLFCWWLFLHRWASSPLLSSQRRYIWVPQKQKLDTSEDPLLPNASRPCMSVTSRLPSVLW